jgi:hypothetical protein
MNNWLKIGLPVLIAILLVVSAVSVTLAVTAGSRQSNAVYQPGNSSTVQYASAPNCHGYYGTNQGSGNTYGPRYGGCPLWRW